MDIFDDFLERDPASPSARADPLVRQIQSGDAVARYLSHLERLFPGCAWLTVPQVAACLKLSAGHIYNLHSAGRLPFKMTKYQSGRLRASVRDIAAYMGDQQAQVLQGGRPSRGPRLRWLHASPQHHGSDTAPARGKQRGPS